MRIAVTGGIGSGKSTVVDIFSTLGFRTCSADAIAREIFSEPEVNLQLAEAVGVVGHVSPSDLRSALAGDELLRRAVNAIMHPAIRQRMRSADAEVFEIPLLIETCTQSNYDFVIVTVCDDQVRRSRLQERYGNQVDLDALMGTQLADSVKMPFADLVVRTDCPIENVNAMIESWVKEFVAL